MFYILKMHCNLTGIFPVNLRATYPFNGIITTESMGISWSSDNLVVLIYTGKLHFKILTISKIQ